MNLDDINFEECYEHVLKKMKENNKSLYYHILDYFVSKSISIHISEDIQKVITALLKNETRPEHVATIELYRIRARNSGMVMLI